MIAIRRARAEEIALPLQWAQAEGWNPGIYDPLTFPLADPAGFFLGEKNGEPVGCISLVKYPPNFAFLGLYIVLPKFRGQGFGLKLWHTAMEYAGDANVGLDGVVAQQANYRKSGFALAYRNIRFERPARAPFLRDPRDRAIEPYADQLFPQICAFDREHFPQSRETFLHAWLTQPESAARICLRDGRILGYGLIRKCHQGHKIGPLFARSAEVAESLFLSLAATAPGEAIYLDVPEPNGAALALAGKYGMGRVFETARMYTGPAPALPLAEIFGVTTFELG